MPRVLLTDEERAARRKARNAHTFSDAAYSHFDPKIEGYGSAAEWERIADDLIAKLGVDPGAKLSAKPKARSLHQEDLEALMLDAVPADLVALKRAYRNMLFVVHPDHGGTSEATRKVVEAFERLLKLFK